MPLVMALTENSLTMFTWTSFFK